MGCSCCANEINRDSYFSKQKNQKISKFIKSPQEQNKIRIDTINSINSINFNGVLNITYRESNNIKSNNNTNPAHHLITELSNSYISRRTNNIKTNENNEENNIINIKKSDKIIQKKNSKNFKQEQMLNLLSLFIKGKTGLMNYLKKKKKRIQKM